MATQPTRTVAPPKTEGPQSSMGYAWYVVGVLTLMYVFSFIDRQIFSLIVAPLRRDLGISDTQVSLLQGFVFALFYTVCGIPLGRLADKQQPARHHCRRLGRVELFHHHVRLCPQLRSDADVAHGRGCRRGGAVAVRLLDHHRLLPARRLATAISVYSMGIYIGSGLSYLLGGIVVRFASAKELWTFPRSAKCGRGN